MQETPHHQAYLETEKTKAFMRKTWRYSLIGTLIVVTVAQIVASRWLFMGRLTVNEFEIMRATFFAVVSAVFFIPLMGLALAGLISLIPVKSYSYRQRFWPTALVTILVLQSLALTSSLYSWHVLASAKQT